MSTGCEDYGFFEAPLIWVMFCWMANVPVAMQLTIEREMGTLDVRNGPPWGGYRYPLEGAKNVSTPLPQTPNPVPEPRVTTRRVLTAIQQNMRDYLAAEERALADELAKGLYSE